MTNLSDETAVNGLGGLYQSDVRLPRPKNGLTRAGLLMEVADDTPGAPSNKPPGTGWR